jgi:hypothetical protein
VFVRDFSLNGQIYGKFLGFVIGSFGVQKLNFMFWRLGTLFLGLRWKQLEEIAEKR